MVKSLVLVETSYSVTSRAGETASLAHGAIGLLLDGGRVLTTGEALEPWRFDASLAEAVQTKDIKKAEALISKLLKGLLIISSLKLIMPINY